MALSPSHLGRLRRIDTRGGNRVRAARQFVRLTQQQLADAIDMTQTSLSDLERQRYGTTTVTTARKFAEYFGCAIEDLFPGVPAKQEVA